MPWLPTHPPPGRRVFGPKPRDRTSKTNRKEKRLAISLAIERGGEYGGGGGVWDRFEKPKTKEFIALMKRWGLIEREVIVSARGFGECEAFESEYWYSEDVDAFDVLNSDKLVFTQASVDYLNEIYGYDYNGETEVGYEDYEEEKQEQEKEGSEGTEGDENSETTK
ncbi:hypothetical protein LOK49_LG02G01480 [Camellia lanceoleosa]|uniref:Uncharacterized protein n=1 Tax=Camellia lanceoleosa TaxID=1840588 RepID=A0ACC0IHU5_9ERIC|nr:hypothetical protein LOK49_LG02G01480 [Camellia lanceoleosa]